MTFERTERLTAGEFLALLESASDWMLWMNPTFGEIELVVKGTDEELTAYHGPDPILTDAAEYEWFAKEAERLSD
jgi:hypothetical protein